MTEQGGIFFLEYPTYFNMLNPVNDIVAVKMDEAQIGNGILINAGTYEYLAPNTGTVRYLSNKAKEIGLNIGDKVLFKRYTGNPIINHDGEELKMLKLENVFGIFEPVEI